MVLKRDFDRCVDTIRTQIEKLRTWGYPAAAVYSIPGGALKLFGSGAITDIVRVHQEEIFEHDQFMEAFDGEEKNSGLLLPVLDPPLLERNFQQTRALAVSVVKASCSGMRRKVGWGDPEKKPEWWPGEVPWEKSGVQSGVTLQQLRSLISACYEHHGQPMEDGEQLQPDEEPERRTQDGDGNRPRPEPRPRHAPAGPAGQERLHAETTRTPGQTPPRPVPRRQPPTIPTTPNTRAGNELPRGFPRRLHVSESVSGGNPDGGAEDWTPQRQRRIDDAFPGTSPDTDGSSAAPAMERAGPPRQGKRRRLSPTADLLQRMGRQHRPPNKFTPSDF